MSLVIIYLRRETQWKWIDTKQFDERKAKYGVTHSPVTFGEIAAAVKVSQPDKKLKITQFMFLIKWDVIHELLKRCASH